MILSFWSTFLQAGRNFFDPVAIRCQDLPRFNPPVGEINPRSLTFWISIRAAVNLGRSLHSLPISHAAVHQEASYSRSTIIGASLSLLWTKDKYFSRNILVRFVKRNILTRVRIRSEGKSWDDGSFEFDVDLPFNRRGSHNAGRNYVTLINPPLSLSPRYFRRLPTPRALLIRKEPPPRWNGNELPCFRLHKISRWIYESLPFSSLLPDVRRRFTNRVQYLGR